MLDELIDGFDGSLFCKFLNTKFAGSFSASHHVIPFKKEFGWEKAERLGVVKTLPGPNGANMPLLIVVAKLPEGETLKERSSRLRQFKFAKQVLDQAMSDPHPGVEGVLTQGLFVFCDAEGNFRLSLVYGKAEGTKLVWSTAKRLSFHVQAGEGNKTFRDRMALPWGSFDRLKEAFSVEKLTKEFYNRLFDWYQWALSPEMNVTYPNDTSKSEDDRQINEHIIRLITRLMFVWFLKQKHLVPDNLFDPASLKKILKSFSPTTGDNYYRAILQNLFFATLNSEISERAFAVDAGNIPDNKEHFGIKTLYRYGGDFSGSEKEVLKLFSAIPFLNGGLFECLDKDKDYYDGFSRNPKKQARIPNRLFFDEAKGLIPLLQQYNFTVEENSPGDEEVALDPELLGKVFENLLGAYNPETNVAARNATGSFYTPREIVNYMVDESLIAHLSGKCGEEHADAIRKLFTDCERPADKSLCKKMDVALITAKILDPACGSGAFPMGVLLRMVELLRILRKLPEDVSVYDLKLELIKNCIYGGDIQCIAVQIAKLRFFISLVCEQKPTANAKENYGIHTLPNLETKFVAADSLIGLPEAGKDVLNLCTGDIADLKEKLFDVRRRHFEAKNYRDKKALRTEDEKLRQKIKETVKRDSAPNRRRLDLLLKEREKVAEPKWVARGPKPKPTEMFAEFVGSSKPEQTMLDVHEEQRKRLDAEIAREQKKKALPATVVDDIAEKLATWDPYNQNKSANFLDTEWMFDVKDGFDIVIGNPPYGAEILPATRKIIDELYKHQNGQADSYLLFMEKAHCLLRSNGVVSYIVSNTWLPSLTFKKIRQLLTSSFTWKSLLVVRTSVFAAVVDTNVFLFKKSKPKETGHVPIWFFTDDGVNFAHNLSWSAVPKNGDAINVIFNPKAHALFQKMRATSRLLKEVATVYNGVKPFEKGKGHPPQNDEIMRCKPFVVTGEGKPTGTDWMPLLRGSLIHRYVNYWENDSWIKYGEWLAAPRDPVIFQAPEKLFVRQTGDSIIATHVSKGVVARDNLHIILPKDVVNLLFILGVLNSRCIDFLYAFINPEKGEALAQVKKNHVEVLPIANATETQQNTIAKIVNRILASKKVTPTADTTKLENEIDELVYNLYGLTLEEKEIVKASVSRGGSSDRVGESSVSDDADETEDAEQKASSGVRKSVDLETKTKKVSKKRKPQLPPSLPGWD